jgi:hypothetical protein
MSDNSAIGKWNRDLRRRELQDALRSKANPIGVAAYTLQSKLPGELKGKLPTAKQLAGIVRAEMTAGG